MIDKHSYEHVHLKVEPKSFLYEFLNSGDPMYCKRQAEIPADISAHHFKVTSDKVSSILIRKIQ